MTIPQAGDKDQDTIGAPEIPRASDSSQVPQQSLPVGDGRDGPNARAPAQRATRPRKAGSSGKDGTQTQDGSAASSEAFSPGWRLADDIFSNRDGRLWGFVVAIIALAVAMAVPVALVYIIVQHVSIAAKAGVGSAATISITSASSLVIGRSWGKSTSASKEPSPEDRCWRRPPW
jgi:hypothetical protein